MKRWTWIDMNRPEISAYLRVFSRFVREWRTVDGTAAGGLRIATARTLVGTRRRPALTSEEALERILGNILDPTWPS